MAYPIRGIGGNGKTTFGDDFPAMQADVAKKAEKSERTTFIAFSNVAALSSPSLAPSEERKGEMYGAML